MKRSPGTVLALRKARGGGISAHTPPPPPHIKKAIPNADHAFAGVAEKFAHAIAADPGRYNIAAADSYMLTRRVKEFRAALDATRPNVRTPRAVLEKNTARKEAEDWVRAMRNQIRGDASIEQKDKTVLGIIERSKTLSKRDCPTSAPVLKYLCVIDAEGNPGAGGGTGGGGVHVVEFHDMDGGKSERKPEGAASLHMYFDLVPPGEPIPQHPAERGWPKFMREFTRSPMKVEFPVPMSGPMVVVYWGRWSDGKGNTGPWSAPCVARIEGTLAVAALPESAVAREQRMVFIQPPLQLIGEVTKSEDADANAQATAAIAALMGGVGGMGGGQRVLEAATMRLLAVA